MTTTFAVFVALAGLVAIVIVGGLLRQIWQRDEERAFERKWQERERTLDDRGLGVPWHELSELSEPAGTPDGPEAEAVARVLYIVARDQPELFAFLRRDFAAEEAEGVIQILLDRRQVAEPREAYGCDRRRSRGVGVNLREIGFALVRQAALPLGSTTESSPLARVV